MKIKSFLKYTIRFVILQIVLTLITIFYFDRFLMNEYQDGYLIIIQNLIEDRDRFYPYISNSFIKIDIYIAIFIFLFLIVLYSTKFFTYVNELTFTVDKNFLDEYFSIFLVWTSSLMTFLFLFRFSVVSRFYLFLLTLLIPAVLQVFRNTEIITSILGRPTTKENFVTINLASDSVFRNLRILQFRRNLREYNLDINNSENVISSIDNLNKTEQINLIIIDLKNNTRVSEKLENYLLNLNKKVLLISDSKIEFFNLFISKETILNNTYLTYFNNDIQYGSKYIIKRIIDIFLSIILIFLFLPLFVSVIIFIYLQDGGPSIIKQNRVGLHGKVFEMYKFRTMYKDSHKKREDLEELNKNDRVIFKIENDPRIFKGGNSIRKYSLDELPQLINVIKGNMSLVGPRPLFEEDTKFFDENYMRRLNVLPGLTGLLQINERNTSEFETWYRYDIDYINNWSIYLDLKILLQTPISIIKNNTKGL